MVDQEFACTKSRRRHAENEGDMKTENVILFSGCHFFLVYKKLSLGIQKTFFLGYKKLLCGYKAFFFLETKVFWLT